MITEAKNKIMSFFRGKSHGKERKKDSKKKRKATTKAGR